MNQSKVSSKWSVLVLSLALFGAGVSSESAAAKTAGTEEGWFNPANPVQETRPDQVTTLELTFGDDNSGNVQSVAYAQEVPKQAKRKVRRLAMNPDEDLTWSFDEEVPEPNYSIAETAGKKTAEIPMDVETLPETAVPPGVPEPDFDSVNLSAFPGNADGNWENNVPQVPNMPVPSFEPEFQNGQDGGRENVPNIPAPETNSGTKLPQAATQIDHFGNIGYTGNAYATRTEDGGQTGNPYASGVFDFHPMYFPWDPMHQTHTRVLPPCESFGTDGYGNNAVTCCDGSCCEYCYEGCDGSCCENCAGCYQSCCGCSGCLGYIMYLLRTGELSAGAYAMQSPIVGSGSNFGVDLGANWSTPNRLLGLTGQIGGRYIRSGRSECSLTGEDYFRTQLFFTTGLFYRSLGSPWKFGAVLDSMRNETEWKHAIGQIRTEISHSLGESTDIGFNGAFHVSDDVFNFYLGDDEYTAKTSALSYYTGFLRHTFVTGAVGTVSCGVTEEKDTLLGCRIEVPVTNHSTIRNSFVYVFPKESSRRQNDSWNASISWVVYLGGSSHVGLASPFKPLFDVADNTTFLQKLL